MKTKDNPGVHVAPPLIYAAFFGLASIARSILPIELDILNSNNFGFIGWSFIFSAVVILIPSLWKFWKTKNTLITIKPANSLQTSGIYAHTRNPMYLGLLLLYTGLSCLSGNCWTLIFLPFLFLVVQYYIILKEERYLERSFTEEYKIYKQKVRRWL